jgi:hypothetical protein
MKRFHINDCGCFSRLPPWRWRAAFTLDDAR